MTKILVVDDDPHIRELVGLYLYNVLDYNIKELVKNYDME